MIEHESGLLTVNGAQLYYECAGAGQPLIMLHGHLLDSGQWDTEFQAWATRYRVVRYDARGFGRSSLPPEPFTYSADLAGVMDALAIDHAVLMGCSGGGATILDFALAYPKRVDALILVGSAVSGYRPSGPVPPQLIAFNEARQKGDQVLAVELSLQAFTDGPRRTAQQVNPVAREQTRQMTAHLLARPVVAEAVPQAPEEPALGRLAEIQAPTLIIVGAEDQPMIHQIADLLAQQIPDAERVTIPDAGHHPNLEHPALFHQIIQTFLQKQQRSQHDH